MVNRNKMFLLFLTFILLFATAGVSEADFVWHTGTMGTRFTVTGERFGIKKPKVYIKHEIRPGIVLKVNAKVEAWSDTSITCLLSKPIPPGIYDLWMKPHIRGAKPYSAGAFTIMPPIIDEVTPDTFTPGATITVSGRYFTNKKPKVYLKDLTSSKKRQCRVVNSTMDPETGVSSLNFVVPQWGAGKYEVILKTSVSQSVKPLSLSINPTILPEGTVGTFYGPESVTMTASGGTPPYHYLCYFPDFYGPYGFVNGGDNICNIDRTPSLHGSHTLNFNVTDALGLTVSADPITIYVNPSSNPLDNWHWRNPVSQDGANFFGVTYGNNTFVAVGSGISTSSDGIEWISGNPVTANYLWAVTYGGGLFIGVGENGTILTSSDGTTWMKRESGITESLYGVTYGDNSFVAVGFNGTILLSSDGEKWTSEISSGTAHLKAVTYGNGLFIAVGDGGIILTSTDGVTWTPRVSGITEDITGVTYGNGLFVAVTWGLCPCGGRCDPVPCGKILTSFDGVEWTIGGTDLSPFTHVAYENGIFIALSDARNFQETIRTSYDGMLWNLRYIEILNVDISKRYFEGVTYGNGTFVAVGQYDAVIQSDPLE